MHETLTTLDSTSVDALLDIKENVNFSSNNIRIGKNSLDKLSVYSNSKWHDWTRDQRSSFKNILSSHIDTAVIGWFITFPANTGFLDTMDYWVDKPDSGTVVAFSLTNNNNITIAGNTVTLNKGEGIKFSLREIHEVGIASSERSWACLMQLQ